MDDVLVLFILTMTPSCFMQGSQIHNKFALAGVVQAHYCFAATFTLLNYNNWAMIVQWY